MKIRRMRWGKCRNDESTLSEPNVYRKAEANGF